MKNADRILTIAALCCFISAGAVPADNAADVVPTTKQERNYIRQGNKLYNDKRFAEAEVAYRKALEALPQSEIAKFNLAAALIRQSGSSDPNSGNDPVNSASQLLQEIAGQSQDAYLAGKSFYNLGNLAFNSQDYGKSIELYKNALRKNPDDDKARENLRIAQLKQQQQQNQDNNQNKDRQQPQGSISDANAEKILKAMENEEAATRKRVEAEKKKAEAARRKKITNPW